jgi:GTP diphosphokinase / guanosine-3',5'-bis(diphosphate) 3'-diphosphatase
MSTLDRAIQIAVTAHAGQIDKGGEPYILHPLRVMLRMRNEEERIAAVLHDVVEDSDSTFESLIAEGFSPNVICALEALTKRPGEA